MAGTKPLVCVVCSRVLPYHLARFGAAHRYFADRAWELQALVVSKVSQEALKVPSESSSLGFVHFLSLDRTHSELGAGRIARLVSTYLERLRPRAVAINGYAKPEAIASLAWCLWRGATPILMTESQECDFPRRSLSEKIKSSIARQFCAALVGGTPHRDYAAKLGLAKESIFTGYDVVDNGYFHSRASLIRRHAHRWRTKLSLPKPFFLTCCRFIPRKNLFRLIAAYKAYRNHDQHPWSLVICGDGLLAGELQRHARGTTGIHWPGFAQMDTLTVYYGLASGFVLPSTTEQWGLVVNEAMASGLPVLVSETAGCRHDLVKHGENGYLFDPYHVEDMAGAMLRMAKLPEQERVAMGKKSRQIISEWGPERFAKGLWKAIQAAGKPKRASVLSRLTLTACSWLVDRFN